MRGSVWLRALLCGTLGVLAIAAFFDAAELHGGYRLPREGVRAVPLDELAFMLWYAVWGGLAVAMFAVFIHAFVEWRLVRLYNHCARRASETLVIVALPLFAVVLGLRHYLLLEQPVADDELTYQLSARTLALGRLTSAPPIDPSFLRNQFVVIGADRWHGKYPIGHSLLLAPFELMGREDLLGALLALGSLALTFSLARRFVGERAALLAAVLLVVSPHFVLTHATLLSQTSSTLLVLLAVLASMRHTESGQARWLWLMGGALGFGVLTRPMPLLLMAAVILVDKVREPFTERADQPLLRTLREALCWGAPLAFFGGIMLGVNYAQSGSATTSGYHEVHDGLGMFQNIQGELTNSLGGALVRENVWLFGWPCSLLFVFFAQMRWKQGLFWGLIASALVYRALVPKTVLSATGPIYVTEIVPLLCIATVAGMQRMAGIMQSTGRGDAEPRIAAIAAAGFIVAACAFTPIQVRELARGAEARDYLTRSLHEQGADRALVFCDSVIPVNSTLSWAYYAPNPWPDLRDDLLYLRVPRGADGARRVFQLWRSRFADRPAFLYTPAKERGQLHKLSPERVDALLAHGGAGASLPLAQ